MNILKSLSNAEAKAATGKKRVAIVGSGISGLSSAYHLYQDFDVTVYEREHYLGGHTDTHTFEIEGKSVNVDSGFIIFCPEYYPYFNAMLEDLGIESKPTNMSFSAHNRKSGTLYNATNLNKLFCDRKNIVKLKFWRMLFDIARFYRNAPVDVAKQLDSTQSVREYLRHNKYSSSFANDHLLPMISALWSATPERVKEFPIKHLVDFFQAHGLLKLIGRPQWLVVKDGSFSYVKALRERLDVKWKVGVGVKRIERTSNLVMITDELGEVQEYDAVIMACHADTSLALLSDASVDETQILGAIPFQENHVVVHTDDTLMHPNKLSWASWNTEVPMEFDANSLRCCTANYWMNSLQGLPIKTNVFTSLNNTHKINESKVLAKRHYTHPVFTAQSVAAQKRLHEINGVQNTYYVGAYWGWGFHEDGARSAYRTSKLLSAHFSERNDVALMDWAL